MAVEVCVMCCGYRNLRYSLSGMTCTGGRELLLPELRALSYPNFEVVLASLLRQPTPTTASREAWKGLLRYWPPVDSLPEPSQLNHFPSRALSHDVNIVFSPASRLYLCQCRQGLLLLHLNSDIAHSPQQQQPPLPKSHPLVIDTLNLPTASSRSSPLVCICTSGDVVPSIQDSVDWPTATPQPLAAVPRQSP
jgi:hypothetical protein